MSAVDFHQILGLAPDASAAEIKRAYKRLAMRWHPDRNPDPQAHVQFRLVREAFEGLTRVRDEAPEQAPRRRTPKGEDRHMDILVDLQEAARGATVTVTIEGREPCDECGGSGQRSYGRTTMCGTCYGSGRIRGDGGLTPCAACNGKGFTTDNHCPACTGRGWSPADRQLAVNIPAAMLPGEELRITGQGGPAPENGEPGDLYLALRARPHTIFRLEGNDIHVTVPVSIFRTLAGGLVEVPTLAGIREVLLSEASAGTEIRIPDAGFPGRGRRPTGDLLVHLQTQYPQFLSKEQKAMLEMAEQVLLHHLEAQSPSLANWNAALEAYR
jgi:molecular chaperone DnaJ